jgi:hypothetical protein
LVSRDISLVKGKQKTFKFSVPTKQQVADLCNFIALLQGAAV